jgi:sugar lactone lactonase YvrE
VAVRRLALAWVVAVTALFSLAGQAAAFTTADGYTAKEYATGFVFAPDSKLGPVGVAFDPSDNLYVTNPIDGGIYRFQPGGGQAGPSTRLAPERINGLIAGLAFTRDGRLYMARGSAGDVVEVDQATGQVKRVVAAGIRCPAGLAADPVSGDLFVSQNTCKREILRISHFADGAGTTSTFADTGCCSDGLAFARDGTLYVASSGHVLQIDGTASATPGRIRSIALVPGADGIAVGVSPAGETPDLVVNRTDGTVTRVDFSTTPPTQTTLLSGGTRGDFVAVDSRGCLYITQTSSIVRITIPGRACALSPSTPGAGGEPPKPGIGIDTVAGTPPPGQGGKCVARKRIVVRVRQRGRVRLRVVRVYVKGKYRKTLRRKRVSAPIVIRHLPRGRFKVKLVARTTKGRKLTARKRFRNC